MIIDGLLFFNYYPVTIPDLYAINENFHRAVLEEISQYKDSECPKIQGKTLIYAVDDQHANNIVKILKIVYGESGVSSLRHTTVLMITLIVDM